MRMRRGWVRYLVADTRKWLPGRKVLISPISIGSVEAMGMTVHVGLSKEQIENAPPLDSDAPVSRQYEIFFNRYYDWADYWVGSRIWGNDLYPRSLQSLRDLPQAEAGKDGESYLRSAQEVVGYRIHARDDDIGHIDDLLVEEGTWVIRYLVIDTSNWIPGSKRVIVDPNWVDSIDWAEQAIDVRMTKEQIESSPEYDPLVPVYRDYEKAIFDHYDFPYYW